MIPLPAASLALVLAAHAAGAARVLDAESAGRVVLDRSSTDAGVPSVVFDHGRHRVMFTCRVCHAELGFALKAGESRISGETNADGQHCGACHDGKALYEGKPIFAACNGWRRLDPRRACARCHVGEGRVRLDEKYEARHRTLPRDASGLVDWNAAERRGLVKPIDTLAGLSGKKRPMRIDRDFDIEVKGTWLGRVTFSHKKHAGWLGCELCHPEIFPVTKRGSAVYGMKSIQDGDYCGVCHQGVAFPISECDRCHGSKSPRH